MLHSLLRFVGFIALLVVCFVCCSSNAAFVLCFASHLAMLFCFMFRFVLRFVLLLSFVSAARVELPPCRMRIAARRSNPRVFSHDGGG